MLGMKWGHSAVSLDSQNSVELLYGRVCWELYVRCIRVTLECFLPLSLVFAAQLYSLKDANRLDS